MGPTKPDDASWPKYVAATVVILVVFGCAQKGTRNLPDERSCELNLQMLGKCIVAYRAKHGEVPPTFTGAEGDEHSWRIRIAIEAAAFSDFAEATEELLDYRFDEPWDSPANRDMLQVLPTHILQCPSESRRIDFPFTSYLMLVRPDEGATRKPLPPEAVIVVESAKCGIQKAEPKDLPWETLWDGNSCFGIEKLHSLHPSVVKALRVDGRVVAIPKDITKEELRMLLNGETRDR